MSIAHKAHSVRHPVSPALNGIVHPWVTGCLAKPVLLHELIARYGSPVHVMRPDLLAQNIERFQATLGALTVRHQLFYTRKANKCAALVRAAIGAGIGIDVSSKDELVSSLALGCAPQSIVVTAAAKPAQLLEQISQHAPVVVLDNASEIPLLKEAAALRGAPLDILIRVCDFPASESPWPSRFGVPAGQVSELLRGWRSNAAALNLRGFHFHLDGYSIAERGAALQYCIKLIDQARSLGLEPDTIDAGGGIMVRYLAREEQLGNFIEALKTSLSVEQAPITFRGDALGLTVDNGMVSGAPRLYPFATPVAMESCIEEILAWCPLGSSVTVAEALIKRDIKVCFELGRALLDQVGITVARIDAVKRLSDGDIALTLEMNQTNNRAVSADFCVDPYFITAIPDDGQSSAAFLFGDTCMESDLILKRRVRIPATIARGDLCVFFNTAGYHMHLFENAGHRNTLPCNIIMNPDMTCTQEQECHQ